jgi:hypothetical protein
MSGNLFLLNDIKKVRESKAKELSELQEDFEKKKVELEAIVAGYDGVIRHLEHGSAPLSYVRKNIDSDLLKVFEESAGDFGITPEECHQHLKANSVDVSLNTVSNRVKDWEKEGKIFQKNVPAKRNRRYILKRPEVAEKAVLQLEAVPSAVEEKPMVTQTQNITGAAMIVENSNSPNGEVSVQ